ncbi:MAG: hypothetical protein M3O33_05380 [Cyanobacteriota bacterium]|nr:hypothetical protein [Cyanobacteriota bacterium]
MRSHLISSTGTQNAIAPISSAGSKNAIALVGVGVQVLGCYITACQ